MGDAVGDDELARLRACIDALDDRLLELLSERARLARQIGHVKGGSTVYRPEREAQVLRRLAGANRGPLGEEQVRRVFVEIMGACRALEENLRVAFLGPFGTYTEEALARHFGGLVEKVPCASIDEVFRSVESGVIPYGIVPVENSTEGAVGRTLDLLLTTSLRICGEVQLPIHHCLLGRSPALTGLRVVCAHPQALAQCQRWLDARLPGVERVPLASNAEAARRAAAELDTAAIASRAAAALYSLAVLAENIEDEPDNTTRFLVIAAHQAGPSGRDKTSIVMSAPNRPGAVHDLLGPLAEHRVSMTRLEARPARTGLWEYVFFVDLEGHQTDPAVAQALAGIESRSSFLKRLGSYPAASG